ncbi:hypothetical protein [uncultured Microbacterium sp.]|uniref:hypothetical protein n=1 Tax=uncultured Microbacterium sp. TaxID=191216 RepID=UPI0037DDAF28
MIREVGVAEELLDATTAQLSGAMNEAALWISRQDDAQTARVRSHAALDALLAGVRALSARPRRPRASPAASARRALLSPRRTASGSAAPPRRRRAPRCGRGGSDIPRRASRGSP